MSATPTDLTSPSATTEITDIASGQPFPVRRDSSRRYVRLQIATPMSLQKIKDDTGNFWPDGSDHVVNGRILNISSGGVLVELDQTVAEGEIVSMHFTLQEIEGLANVLGQIKRVELDTGGPVAGIQFVTKAFLLDAFSSGEMDLLEDRHSNFDDSVRNVLGKYIREEMLNDELD